MSEDKKAVAEAKLSLSEEMNLDFLESIAKTNTEKITKEILEGLSEDTGDSDSYDVESAGVIREVKYPEWLANTVMVKKANGKWRMCIDFTNLNKACPQDEFPLPRIDSLVDKQLHQSL